MTLAPRLDDLAHALAAHGIAAHEPEITAAARVLASPLPRSRILLSVLLDRTASPVARERAFGLLYVDHVRALRAGQCGAGSALVA